MHAAQPGPPPELLARIVADLASELARPAPAIHVERVEPVTWRDGSLGCPEPGMVYTQALVPGFRVILAVDGQLFDYRTGRGGAFKRCAADPTADRPSDRGDPIR